MPSRRTSKEIGWAIGIASLTAARWALGVLCLLAVSNSLVAAELTDAQKSYLSGDYEKVLKLCEAGLKSDTGEEDWPLLLGQTLMTLGRYSNAQGVVRAALDQFPFSLRVHLLAREAALYNNDPSAAKELLDETTRLVERRRWAYQDAHSLVALGKIALLLGADPKKVLDNTFDRAKKADPQNREAQLAAAQVALDKNDFDLAAKLLREALKAFPKDPDFHLALAQAMAGADRKTMLEEIDEALSLNENHVPSYLLLVDHLIDAEAYEDADSKLERVLQVNPNQPEAWALKSVISHLRGEEAKEQQYRSKALAFYHENPAVDYLIGRKLSQKYRFTEAASHQRAALKFDPHYVPAKSQLAQDLLRLGQDEEGWSLVEQSYQEDGYDVVAFNLANLKDALSQFAVLTNQSFILRMGQNEAPIFGERALALLTRAHSNLCTKYGMELQDPTVVEIFPDQKDFAVRTFGVPGGAGYLGVCFGRVITANSPSTQSGKAASWESVLWHEFTHVVTLQMTKNKMPRWLSEGISVYEERQANPKWGQALTPRYREMILGKDLRKISELSAAFLAPPSGEHLMFAYYESYLVVQFLVEKYGFEALRKILRDLKVGVDIQDALARNTSALDLLETDFASYAKEHARALASTLTWEKPKPEDLEAPNGTLSDWVQEHPQNYYALQHQARHWIKARKWEEAKKPLQKLIEAFPIQIEPGNPYQLLAQAHRALKETEQEREVLIRWASIDPNASDAFLRLMELGTTRKDWPAVLENGERGLSVNPLAYQIYQYIGRASEETRQPSQAIQAYQTLLRLSPPDPAGAHYRLAVLLKDAEAPSALRHVLEALEHAPRFRDAHQLLLELSDRR